MSTIWQRPWIRAITTILVIALMTGIFLFSNQGKQSETTSESFAFVIIDTVHPEYQEATTEEQYDIWNAAQRIARKAAHIVEYLALGFLIRLCLESWFGYKPKWKWIAFAIGAAYAASDEIHQYFVPGRSCEVLDVLIDSLGVFLGVLLAVWLIRSVARYARRDYTMEPWSKKKLLHSLLLSPVFGALLTLCLELGFSFLRKDTPGSLLRHLAFFAACTGIMAGATLLCAFTKPIRKLWDWLDQNLLTQETRKPVIDIIYAALALPMLLHHFYVMLYYPKVPAGASKLAPVWIVLAVLTVLLGKTWKHKGFLFISFFLIYTFENLYLNKLIISGQAPVYFSSALYSLFLAYGVFFVIRPKYRRIFLQAFCALWSLGALALCGAGLYTSWTGINVKNLVETQTSVYAGRLTLFANTNISAVGAASGAVIALIGFAVSKHWPVKVIYLVPCLVSLVTTSLTDARSSMYMLSCMLAGTVALGVWGILAKCTAKLTSKVRIPLLIVSIPACFALCFIMAHTYQPKLPKAFTEVRNRGGIVIPSAIAEEASVSTPEPAPGLTPEPTPVPTPTPPPPVFQQRENRTIDLSDETAFNSSMTGRVNIWKSAQKYLEEHPETLRLGLTVDGSAPNAVNRDDHFHNILIQTLMEGGIPGLALFLALLSYFLFHTIRLWAHWDLPLWQRILPMPVLSLLLMEMAECLTHFAFGHPPMTLMYFFMGCTVATSLSLKKKSADDTAP